MLSAGAKACEQNEASCGGNQKERAADGKLLCRDVLRRESVHGASKAPKVCWVRLWCYILQWATAICYEIACEVGVGPGLGHQGECGRSCCSKDAYVCNGRDSGDEKEGNSGCLCGPVFETVISKGMWHTSCPTVSKI